MGKRLKGWLLILCVFVIGLSMMNIACADIPSGVKDHYEYNQTDRSIVKVKKRLQELGFFGKSVQFSNTVSEDLKKAVIAFQEQNAVMADGVIDKDFLELLFSDDAIEKGGKPNTETKVVTEKPPETEETNAVPGRTTTQNKESKEEKKKDTVDAFAIIAGVVIFTLIAMLIISAVKKSKVRALVEIIERYKELRKDERCKKAIYEAGIIMGILASGGEYFLIPLMKDGNRYNMRFDHNTVVNAEEKCGTSIITVLDS